MSSFVIGKIYYIRVAGLMAGIARNSELWLYDYEMNRNMIGEDYVRKLTACYELNVDSVCKQYAHDSEEGGYGNPATYADGNQYLQDFHTYFQIGRKVADNKKELLTVLKELRYFSRSVSYQIEDETDNSVVMEFFNAMIGAVLDVISRGYESENWGEFSLKEKEGCVCNG